MNDRFRAIAVVFASLVIPGPMLAGRITEAIMDSTNPAGLDDLAAGLAYLTEILTAALITLVVVVVGFVAATIMAWVRRRRWDAVRLPLLVFAVQVIVGVALIVANEIVESVGG